MPDTKLYDPARDFRQASFQMTLNDQNFELAILSVVANDKMFFYAIFKPEEYDHVIHITPLSSSWNETVVSLASIFNQVCDYFKVDRKNFQQVIDFLPKPKR